MAIRTADRARDMAAVVVLVVAAFAIIATSPAQVSVELPIRSSGRVELTSVTPVAVIPITVRASDEALWPSDPDIRLNDAWIFFLLDMAGVAQHANAEAPVRLTLIPLDASGAGGEALANSRLDLDRLCPPDRDCELQFDLVLEWLEPVADGTLPVGWEADGRITLYGSEELPLDATARVESGEPQLQSVPTLSDHLSEEGIRLSVDQPLAIRHIVIEATADALPAAVEYPLEGWAVVTIRSDTQAARPMRAGESGLAATLVPDPGTPAFGAAADLLGARTPLNPFAGCAIAEPCRHGYTLRLEWVANDPTATMDVSWELDARLLYHEGPGPGEDAAVALEQDGAWSASGDSPALTATRHGRLDVPNDDGGIRVRRTVTISLSPQALPVEEPIAGGPPAVAIVTVRAGADRDFGEEPLSLLVSLDDPGDSQERTVRPNAPIGGDPTRVAIFPLRGCEQGQPCEVSVTIGAGVSANDLGRVAGAGLWLDWEMEIRLPYLSLDAVPPGAALDITDE